MSQYDHARYVDRELDDGAAPHVLLQPENRGTGTAIVYAAHMIRRLDPEATVAVFPSDHYIREEDTFLAHVAEVVRFVERHPERLILLGARPTSAGAGVRVGQARNHDRRDQRRPHPPRSGVPRKAGARERAAMHDGRLALEHLRVRDDPADLARSRARVPSRRRRSPQPRRRLLGKPARRLGDPPGLLLAPHHRLLAERPRALPYVARCVAPARLDVVGSGHARDAWSGSPAVCRCGRCG